MWLLAAMSVPVQVALVTAGGAVGAAGVTTWRTRQIEETKQRAEAAHTELEERRFSMDYWERRAAVALEDATRWEQKWREEHAVNDALAAVNERLDRENAALRAHKQGGEDAVPEGH